MAACAFHRADVGLISGDDLMHKFLVASQAIALEDAAVALVDENRLVEILERERLAVIPTVESLVDVIHRK